MRNMIRNIIAGGPPAVVATGLGVMYASDQLHWLMRPSIRDTLFGVAAIGGATLWAKLKGKKTPPQTDTLPQAEEPKMVVWEEVRRAQELPRAQTYPLNYTSERATQRQRHTN